MELYQLRTFVAVADQGHLTRAADRLHLSQPAVSAHVKALETELDAQLFERTPIGMVLTVAGRALIGRARDTLAAADALRRAAKNLKGEIAGRLRIGTLTDPQLIRLGDLLSRTVKRHPLLELELHQEISGAALDSVRDGRLDASFYFGDAPGSDIASVRLRPIVYRVTAPIAWKARVAEADWQQMAALPWVVTPATSTHSRLVSRLFGQHGIPPPRYHIEADNEAVIENLVVSGLGVSLMREERAALRQRAGEICVWDKAELTTTLWFIHPQVQSGNPLIGALLEVLGETWQSAGPETRAETAQEI